MERDTYTAADLARLCGVSRQAVCNWIVAGKVKANRLGEGRHWVISQQEVKRVAEIYCKKLHG